ncbi:hypothetical protein O7635_24745 [Asanoa sp. WMMD1127]|nr:hypothetical protein [Asanoa sp. WMMD1127]MDG4825070.1 hypothetical protein [Asanoa sp. WMMD1127]
MSTTEATMTAEKLAELIQTHYFDRFVEFGEEFDFCWSFAER